MFEPGTWSFVIAAVFAVIGAASVACCGLLAVWIVVDTFRRPVPEQVGSGRGFTVPREVTDFPWTEGR